MAPQHCWGPCKGQGSSTKEQFRHWKTQSWCRASQTPRSLKGQGGELDQAHLSSPAPIPPFFFLFFSPFPLTPAPAVLYPTQDCFTDSLIHCLVLSKMHAMVWALSKVKHIHTVKCWAISGLQMGDKGRLELHSLILKKKKEV